MGAFRPLGCPASISWDEAAFANDGNKGWGCVHAYTHTAGLSMSPQRQTAMQAWQTAVGHGHTSLRQGSSLPTGSRDPATSDVNCTARLPHSRAQSQRVGTRQQAPFSSLLTIYFSSFGRR